MQYSNNKELQVSALTKIYVWSVLFEPLLYFVILPQNITGVGGNISRLFQLIVIFLLIFKFLVTLKIRFPNPFSITNRFFSYYYFYMIVIGIIGYLTGSYSYSHENLLISNYDNFFSKLIIGNTLFRPFFEYFIALYYFIYFVILAQYILISKRAIDYFFKWFNVLFLICIFLGFFDLLLLVLFNPEYQGIGRHIADNQFPGNRFHGIAGEPRDAFIYLFLCLGIFSIRDIWTKQKRLNYFWIVLIFIAMYLSQSFSGILGLILAMAMLSIYFLPSLQLRKQAIAISLFFLFALLMLLNVKYSIRMTLYYDAFFSIYQTLNNGQIINSILSVAMNNIYPIWHLWTEVRELNFYHLFFGNGLGSSALINNFYYNEPGIINPNASIVRMLYESGIIGIFLFINAFIRPLIRLNVNYKIYNKLLLLMLIMLGLYFSHRSVAPYLFLGIAIVVFRYRFDDMNSKI